MRTLSRVLSVVSVCVALSGCSSEEASALAGQLLGTHVISDGRTLHLYDVRTDRFIERSHAAIPANNLLDGQEIFSVVQHPKHPEWFFTSSLNECDSGGSSWCLGNGRIDRFRATDSGLLYDGVVYRFEPGPSSGPNCASQSFGHPGQVGTCAPKGMTFSADGSRLYVQEDYNATLDIFSVDDRGDATFLAEGGFTNDHGLVMYPDGQFLYNGQLTFDVSNDTPVHVFGGIGGSGGQIVERAGARYLITGIADFVVVVFGLVTPAAPSVQALAFLGPDSSRDVAIDASDKNFITVGQNTVTTMTWDGAFSIAPQQQLILSKPFTVQNMSVAYAAKDTAAVAAWFDVAGPDNLDGGATLYSYGPNGQIAEVATVNFPNGSRVVRPLTTN
jgi:hypothetical protein